MLQTLKNNKKNVNSIKKMLKKKGVENEKIHFADFVVKINRKEKKQIRLLLITNNAIYNLMPNKLSKCRRRITLESIGSITMSKLSDEFVFHILDEYDYRFKSNKKEIIKQVIADLYAQITNSKVNITYVMLNRLRGVVLTKKKMRMQSREEKLKRRAMLLELDENDSDKEQIEKHKSEVVENMLEPSKKIGIEDFTLLKVIGRGSFGKVLQVRKKDDGKIYAMKILKKSGVVYKNQIEHTKAERQILQMLEHPFLMKLRFAFQTKQKLYIVIDFYKGGELFFHLKKKTRFTEDEARIILAETVLALGHLHKNDVFYRDLKPENILLDDEGHICLTDFGLSKVFSEYEEKTAFTFCGTPEYLAPEIIQRKEYSRAVDWWSLGILLYEIVVGYPPFNHKEITEMYNMIQFNNLNPPKFLSKSCRDLMMRLAEKKPEDRIGAGPRDYEEIMSHNFFSDINWELVLEKKVKPIYIPKVKSRETDTTNFDSEFTNEPVVDSYAGESSINEEHFIDFTYHE